MATLLRALCVASCFLTGIYYLTLSGLNNKGSHRKLWFPVLCFALGISTISPLSFYLSRIYDNSVNFGVTDNLFFVFLNYSSLAMNIYNGFFINGKNTIIFKTVNIVCFIVGTISFFVPHGFTLPLYFVSLGVCLITYMLGLYSSFIVYNKGSKAHLFSLISYLIFIAALIPDIVLVIFKVNSVSFRMATIPIYLYLHLIMLTALYRDSLSRTKELSSALSETIEKINHSDNALKCTQMKPDFLYETLELISNRCESDPFTAEDLTISLSKYLRHTLNFQQLKGIVPLSNELELTKAYIAIERERYPHIKFEYNFPYVIPEVYVPPLSIQPLIENALEHGFGDFNANGKIKISIVDFKDYCHIDVSDTGKGIPEEMLAGLPASFAQTARIGLNNINSRLINKFGNGLVIQSAEDVGTSISFTVPPEGRYNLSEEEVL